MSLPRIIKKYPNRRLYDTERSRYITLADIRQLVIDSIDFKVVDKQSQADITTTILLQVITEQENAESPMLSREFLAGVIRSQGDTLQGVVKQFLEQSMNLFSAQQQELRNLLETAAVGGKEISGLANDNLSRFSNLQKEVFSRFATANSNPDNRKSDRENG